MPIFGYAKQLRYVHCFCITKTPCYAWDSKKAEADERKISFEIISAGLPTTLIISKEESKWVKQFSTYKMDLQVSYSICAEIQKTGDIRKDKSGYWTDIEKIM
jgi:hypothetical protein